MVTEPMFTPVTCGCEAGVVAPAAMVTVAGETETFEASLLVSVTVICDGAGAGRVTAKPVFCPRERLVLGGVPITPALWTVMFAVVSAMLGDAPAWITADPKDTPVTGTLTVVAPGFKVTVDGTVA